MANLTYLYCRTQNEAALHGHPSYYLTWKHLIVWKIKEAQAQLHLGLITLCVGGKKEEVSSLLVFSWLYANWAFRPGAKDVTLKVV